MRYFAPAFPSLVQCYKIVETLTRSVRQQVRVLQFTPAKSGGCPLRLQRRDGDSGLRLLSQIEVSVLIRLVVPLLRKNSLAHRCGGRRVACNVICIPQTARLPLQIPRQRIQIDIAAGKNNSHAFSIDVDYWFENRGIRNSC